MGQSKDTFWPLLKACCLNPDNWAPIVFYSWAIIGDEETMSSRSGMNSLQPGGQPGDVNRTALRDSAERAHVQGVDFLDGLVDGEAL